MSTPDPPYQGRCLCGAIRFRVNTKPLTLYACHCTDCQRQTGASFALSMVVLREAVELLEGDPASFDFTTAEGIPKGGRFCPDCSCRLWGEPSRYPQVAVVRPGTLADTSWIDPVAHIWVRSKQAGIAIPEGVAVFETQSEDPLELIRLWGEREEG